MRIGEIFKDKLEYQLKKGEAQIRTLEEKNNQQNRKSKKEFFKKLESLHKKQKDMKRILEEVKQKKRNV